jgi:hypothetical protein
MKTHTILTSLIFTLISFASISQLQVRNDEFIQVGYDDYRALTFGIDNNAPNNGMYSIEHWNNGLNFWKPFPSPMSANYILFLRDDNHIGMGTTGSSNYRLDVAGNARSWGWYTFSDERLKTKIEPLKGSLDKILQMQGVSYQFKGDTDKYADLKDDKLTSTKAKTIENDAFESKAVSRIGFLAQDIQKVLPSAVQKEENGYLSVNYNEIIPLLVEGLKEQQNEINELKLKIKELSSKIK